MQANEIDRIAVVAGAGRFPELLLDALLRSGTDVSVLALPGFDPGKRYFRLTTRRVSLESFPERLAELRSDGHRRLTFAGAARRPQTGAKPEKSEHPPGLPNIHAGDDSVLRSIVDLAENAGFEVIGGHELLPDLVSAPGALTRSRPGAEDRLDIERAASIVQTIGPADVGQAAVVVCRLCVAIETVSGTDAMLDFAAGTINRVNPMPGQARGIMYKGPKPGQELRLDMPAIGPGTVRGAANAGLSGIAVEAGTVLILDRDETIAAADRNQMFIWARHPSGR